MKKLLLTIAICLFLAICSCNNPDKDNYRWTEQKVNMWYDTMPWIKGFNYVPSYAGNTTEWWENSLDTTVVARELGWAKDLGYTSTRVFLQYIVWKKDPLKFKKNFEMFLRIADSKNISVIPTLFDDCAFGAPPQLDPFLGKQRDIIPGMILSNWTPSPGKTLGNDSTEITLLKQYIDDIIKTYSSDQRIIMWDLFNEPMNAAKTGTADFLVRLFSWAREVNPSQPLTIAAWGGRLDSPTNIVMLAYSDVISFHLYGDSSRMSARIKELKRYNRPVICTEWMARPSKSSYEKDLPLLKSEKVAAYQWGLVNGRTQCQYPWWNKAGGQVDSVYGWFHDILYSDGRPYRQEEIDIIKKY